MTPPCDRSFNWLVFGGEAEPAAPEPLRAGPLSLLCERGSGFLRRISLGDIEILRGIYAAVRDRNWNTIPGIVDEIRSEVQGDSFLKEFQSVHRQGETDFIWRGMMRGEADGTIHYEFVGEARSTFLRNRIGFCVLHPIRGCAGANARQTRTDGSVIEGRFPTIIEPQIFGQSSFQNLRSIAHEFAPGRWAEVEFEGDIFEMEDQRNWTDASFKTYCTPLSQPFPVKITAGTRIRQKVTLRLMGSSAGKISCLEAGGSRQDQEPITVSVAESSILPMPRIGLGMNSSSESLTEAESARVRELKPSHLRVDVRLSAPNWRRVWNNALREARQLGACLEAAIHLPSSGDGCLAEWRDCLLSQPAPLSRVLALREGEAATSRETLALVRKAIAGVDAPVGAGSNANFCELNREQALGKMAITEADFVFWSINPQVHACDTLSIVETLEAQPDTLRTARMFAGGKPLVISPVTLKPRFNAVAMSATDNAAPDEFPSTADPRQLSLFLAAWTLGSLAVLSAAGAESVTLFETAGVQGLMERDSGPSFQDKFPSQPGAVFPVYPVLAGLAAFREIIPLCVSAPMRLAAMAVVANNRIHKIVLGNLTAQPQRIRLPGIASSARVWELDSTAMQKSMSFHYQPGHCLAAQDGVIALTLPPFACAFLVEFTGLRPM